MLNITAVEELPSSDRCCSNLRYLYMSGCESLKHLPNSLSNLTVLTYLSLNECKQLDTSNLQILFDGLSSLRNLTLNGCDNLYELPENISKLSLLRWLSLSEPNVKSLPESITHLSQLESLNLSKCRRLQSLLELPASVYFLVADECTSLERVFTPTPELLEEHIRLCNIEINHFSIASFSFDNCPNLEKDALDAIDAYVKCCSERRIAIYHERRRCFKISHAHQ